MVAPRDPVDDATAGAPPQNLAVLAANNDRIVLVRTARQQLRMSVRVDVRDPGDRAAHTAPLHRARQVRADQRVRPVQ